MSILSEQVRNRAMNEHKEKIQRFIELSGKVQEAMKETNNVIRQVSSISDFRDKLDLPELELAGRLSETCAESMIFVLENHLKDLEHIRGHYTVWFTLEKK